VNVSENRLDRDTRTAHWDSVYQRHTPSGVSWYEPEASTSLSLIKDLNLPTDTPILDVGGGASTLVDGLVAGGYSDVSVLDLSSAALEASRDRLGPDVPVRWLNEDLLNWVPERRYGLWHDRAVFHFLTDPEDRTRYLDLMARAVAPEGRVIMQTFAPDGPDSCSGLPVARYSAEDLARALAPDFEVIDSGRQAHVTPSAKTQPFTWVVAARSRPK
jgi:hypothetical protein